MSTLAILSHAPCRQARKPIFPILGTYAGGPRLFEVPLARALEAGDITQLEGRFVRMIPNHNGQRLQSVDCHEEVVAGREEE